MIEVEDLHKSFGKTKAVRGVSFVAEPGKITGLLGPNGAGKSTCLRVLYTVVKPDRGRVRLGGLDVVRQPSAVRKRMGVLPHGAGLYPNLSARENIEYYGRLHGLPADTIVERMDNLSRVLELSPFLDRPCRGFSQGQQTRVALARALIHDPSHVILDEPTSGLDVMATRRLREHIRQLRDMGRCLLISTHVMQEAAELCDEIVVVAGGRARAQSTLEGLLERTGARSLEDAFVRLVDGREEPS